MGVKLESKRFLRKVEKFSFVVAVGEEGGREGARTKWKTVSSKASSLPPPPSVPSRYHLNYEVRNQLSVPLPSIGQAFAPIKLRLKEE